MPAEIVRYTITGAQDWPMFKWMVGMLGAMFVFLWAIIVVLIKYYHNAVVTKIDGKFDSVMERIATHRKSDQKHCEDCGSGTALTLKAVWNAIEDCCPRLSREAKDEVDKFSCGAGQRT